MKQIMTVLAMLALCCQHCKAEAQLVRVTKINPANQTVATGSAPAIEVFASGAPPLSYKWYFGTNAIKGATNSILVLTNVQPFQSGTYFAEVTSGTNSSKSKASTLSISQSPDISFVPAIKINGERGQTYLIEYIVPGPTNVWTPVASVTLTNSSQIYVDYGSLGQSNRLYRIRP